MPNLTTLYSFTTDFGKREIKMFIDSRKECVRGNHSSCCALQIQEKLVYICSCLYSVTTDSGQETRFCGTLGKREISENVEQESTDDTTRMVRTTVRFYAKTNVAGHKGFMLRFKLPKQTSTYMYVYVWLCMCVIEFFFLNEGLKFFELTKI